MDSCTAVRTSCAAVMARAQSVRIDDAALGQFASKLAKAMPDAPNWDAHDVHYSDDAGGRGTFTASYVMVLDTLNFCFWPSDSGLEYNDLATKLRDVVRKAPMAFSAEALQHVTEADVASWLAPHMLPNLATRAAFLRELGTVLLRYAGGDPVRLLRGCRHSAVALVDLLVAYFPNLRDEAVYADPAHPGSAARVFLYKRAQIMVADLWAAFGRQTCTQAEAAAATTPPSSPGLAATGSAGSAGGSPRVHPAAFHDIHRLTCFADYRIPQVLRAEGVMVYAPGLASRVDSLALIPAGSCEEIEIRAATVTAVEALRRTLAEQHGQALTAVEVDWRLWQIGEEAVTTGDKALARTSPHHRTDTVFY